MAQLTWRNVDAPSFSGVNDLMRTSTQSMNQGFEALRKGLDSFQEDATQRESARLVSAALGTSDPAQLQALIAGANGSFVSPEALKFVTGRPSEQARLEQTQTLTKGYLQNQAESAALHPYQVQQAQANVGLTQANTVQQNLANALAEATQQDNIAQEKNATTQGTLTNRRTDLEIKELERNQGYAAAAKEAIAKAATQGTLENGEAYIRNLDIPIEAKTMALDGFKKAGPGLLGPAPATGHAAAVDRLIAAQTGGAPTQATAQGSVYRRGGGLINLIDQHEGAGDYSTLFGHAQKKGPLAGTDVSRMTVGQLSQFASADGEYGRSQINRLGYLATPMGRYQIVGKTLQATAKEMGLSPDTVFTPEVQDAMFAHLAAKRINGPRSMEQKVAGLREEWEGFKNVPTAQLEKAIAAFQNGQPEALATIGRSGGGSGGSGGGGNGRVQVASADGAQAAALLTAALTPPPTAASPIPVIPNAPAAAPLASVPEANVTGGAATALSDSMKVEQALGENGPLVKTITDRPNKGKDKAEIVAELAKTVGKDEWLTPAQIDSDLTKIMEKHKLEADVAGAVLAASTKGYVSGLPNAPQSIVGAMAWPFQMAARNLMPGNYQADGREVDHEKAAALVKQFINKEGGSPTTPGVEQLQAKRQQEAIAKNSKELDDLIKKAEQDVREMKARSNVDPSAIMAAERKLAYTRAYAADALRRLQNSPGATQASNMLRGGQGSGPKPEINVNWEDYIIEDNGKTRRENRGEKRSEGRFDIILEDD